MDKKEKYCMISYENNQICIDNSIELFNLLGKKYTVMIITLLANKNIKNKNFNEIVNDLPGSDKTIISLRLRQLIKLNIIKKIYNNKSISYELTEKGNEILNLMMPIFKKMEEN